MFEYKIEEFLIDIKVLANKVKESKISYDGIIAVTRGGIIPAGYLSQYLTIKKLYTCGGYFNKDKKFEFINVPTPIKGKILMISDLVKTGETLEEIVKTYKEKKSGDLEIDIACIHYFSTVSKNIIPKYYVHKYEENLFVIYPWEN